MITYELTMTKTEIKPLTVEALDLKTGETIESAVVTHIPPSGDPLTISATVETSPYADLEVGPLAVPGRHFVKVQMVGSDGSKPEVVYDITVRDV